MKLSIEGTPEEIKNALQAICGSKERDEAKNYLSETKQMIASVTTSDKFATVCINKPDQISIYQLPRN